MPLLVFEFFDTVDQGEDKVVPFQVAVPRFPVTSRGENSVIVCNFVDPCFYRGGFQLFDITYLDVKVPPPWIRSVWARTLACSAVFALTLTCAGSPKTKETMKEWVSIVNSFLCVAVLSELSPLLAPSRFCP